MEQKTTWKRYFLIGISLILCSGLIFSCGKTRMDYLLKTSYRYKNLTSEKVEIKLFNEQGENYRNYFMPPDGELLLSFEIIIGPKNGIIPPFYKISKIVLRFTASDKCIENYSKLLDKKQYDNFDESMYNKSDNLLNYTIDEEDYKLAEACK